MKKNAIKLINPVHVLAPAMAVFFAAVLLLFLPVTVSPYSSLGTGTLQPFGPIIPGHQLEQCIDGVLENIDSIDLFTATYRRSNTNINKFEMFRHDNGKKTVLNSQDFGSVIVPDNRYFSLKFSPVSSENGLCFSLSSGSGSPGNAITVWQNSLSNPVFRLKTTLPFYQALDYIHADNPFELPLPVLVVIALLFLAANLFTIVWIIHSFYEHKKASKSKNS